MAATNSSKRTNKPTICILYGFCEGRHMAAPFLRAAKQAGYQIVGTPDRADILVAHSGGCFAVPATTTQPVFMIGLTYWPGKSILQALLEKNWNDFRLHRGDRNLRTWLHKFLWNLAYFWNMRNNLRMLRGRKHGDFWRAEHVVLVRNKEDSFCTPDVASMPFDHRPDFAEVPDQHDDIWLHPERYVAIINKYAIVLAQTGKR